MSEEERPTWAEPFGEAPSAADLPYVRETPVRRQPARRVGIAVAAVITVLAAAGVLGRLRRGAAGN